MPFYYKGLECSWILVSAQGVRGVVVLEPIPCGYQGMNVLAANNLKTKFKKIFIYHSIDKQKYFGINLTKVLQNLYTDDC